MTLSEFNERTNAHLTEDQYKPVENMYNEAGNIQKDKFLGMEKYVLYYRYTCDRTGEEWGDNEECFAESSEDAVKIGKSRIHPFAQNNMFLVSVTLNGKQVWHV